MSKERLPSSENPSDGFLKGKGKQILKYAAIAGVIALVLIAL